MWTLNKALLYFWSASSLLFRMTVTSRQDQELWAAQWVHRHCWLMREILPADWNHGRHPVAILMYCRILAPLPNCTDCMASNFHIHCDTFFWNESACCMKVTWYLLFKITWHLLPVTRLCDMGFFWQHTLLTSTTFHNSMTSTCHMKTTWLIARLCHVLRPSFYKGHDIYLS